MTSVPKVSEKEWQQTVVDTARAFGWRVYHTFDSRKSAAGFPDLVMVRRSRIVFAELKAQKGRLTSAQEDWMFDLLRIADLLEGHLARTGLAREDAGVQAHIWKPEDWPLVERTLR
jgi:hypothetical protein